MWLFSPCFSANAYRVQVLQEEGKVVQPALRGEQRGNLHKVSSHRQERRKAIG